MGDVNVAHADINISVQSVTHHPVPPSRLWDKLAPGIFSIEPLHFQIVFLGKLLVEVGLDAAPATSGNIYERREVEEGECHGRARVRFVANWGLSSIVLFTQIQFLTFKDLLVEIVFSLSV